MSNPRPPRDGYIHKTAIPRERKGPNRLIDKYPGAPDRTAPNKRDERYPIKLYSIERIREVERREDFRDEMQKAQERRHAVMTKLPPMKPIREAAVRYHDLRFCVVPLAPLSKSPK